MSASKLAISLSGVVNAYLTPLHYKVHRDRPFWGSDAYGCPGPALFRYGFAFAVGITLLPVPLSIVGWILQLLGID